MNPCDILFFAHHIMMQRAGQTGNLPFMILDVEGEIEPARLDAAVAAALRAHPAGMRRATTSLIRWRPSWQAVDERKNPAVIHHDLRSSADWHSHADSLCQDYFAAGWNVFASPQVRLEYYRGRDHRGRLCLRW